MPSSRGSSQPRDQTHMAGGFFCIYANNSSTCFIRFFMSSPWNSVWSVVSYMITPHSLSYLPATSCRMKTAPYVARTLAVP